MGIKKAFEAAFRRKREKGWEKIYVVVDIHDTILHASYDNEETYSYLPYAREAMQLLSNRDDICLILWSGCHQDTLEAYQRRFAEDGIHFDYLNENPEVGNSSFQNFDKKLYYNVGIDDRFGFNPETDWVRVIEAVAEEHCGTTPAPSRIYVASSWRNKYQPEVVARLRRAGYQVYDFRDPEENPGGFHWADIDEDWLDWSPEEYIGNLDHPIARKGFRADMNAMEWADACVLVLPCGRSAHTEAGWFAGKGLRTIVYIPEKQEPELMYKVFDSVVDSIDGILEHLR